MRGIGRLVFVLCVCAMSEHLPVPGEDDSVDKDAHPQFQQSRTVRHQREFIEAIY